MNTTAQATPGQGRTLDSLRHYLANNPGNEPVAPLGMPSPDEQRQTLTAQLRALTADQAPGSTQPEPRTNKTLRDYAETMVPAESLVAGLLTANRTTESERPGDDQQLRQKLEQLKQKYAREFASLQQTTQTRLQLNNWRTDTTKPYGDELGYSTFTNRYTPDAWFFLRNKKSRKMDRKAFFLSNVVVLQYEKAAADKGWSLSYPATISRCNISNPDTIAVLETFHGRYDTPEFREAYLNTDNGKSTLWVIRDLGMKIDRFAVNFVDTPANNYTKEYIETHYGRIMFTVVTHVSSTHAATHITTTKNSLAAINPSNLREG